MIIWDFTLKIFRRLTRKPLENAQRVQRTSAQLYFDLEVLLDLVEQLLMTLVGINARIWLEFPLAYVALSNVDTYVDNGIANCCISVIKFQTKRVIVPARRRCIFSDFDSIIFFVLLSNE